MASSDIDVSSFDHLNALSSYCQSKFVPNSNLTWVFVSVVSGGLSMTVKATITDVKKKPSPGISSIRRLLDFLGIAALMVLFLWSMLQTFLPEHIWNTDFVALHPCVMFHHRSFCVQRNQGYCWQELTWSFFWGHLCLQRQPGVSSQWTVSMCFCYYGSTLKYLHPIFYPFWNWFLARNQQRG